MELLTFEQARQELGLREATLRQYVHHNLIPSLKIGGGRFFERKAIEAYKKRRRPRLKRDHRTNA